MGSEQLPENVQNPQKKQDLKRVRLAAFLKRFAIVSGVGTLLCFGLMTVLDVFSLKQDQAVRNACDAFFVVAVFLLAVGIFGWLTRTGGFHGLGYSAYSRYTLRKEKPLSYYDYVSSKNEKAQTKRGSSLPYFAAGAIFLLVAAVLLIVYYNLA